MWGQEMRQDDASQRKASAKPRQLSSAFVRNISEPGKYGDGNGLALVVSENGKKRWVQRLTIRGKRCDLGLGSHSMVSLAEAREVAAQNAKEARAGGDPKAARDAARAVLSFEDAAREVHRLHSPTWRNAKHRRDFIASLEAYAFPRLGAVRVSEVTAADVLAVLTPIWTQKPETARRVRQRIGTILKWAVAQGWRQDNPADAITTALPKVTARPVHRKALPYEQVGRCIEAFQQSGAMPSTKLALEFLILTAARSGEVREATWDEIDLGAKVWIIPAERMKAKRPHRVPLSARAIEILEAAQDLRQAGDYLFPGAKGARPLSDMTLSKTVKALGYPVDVHGFRTSFRTWAQERTSFPREVAEASLAHMIGDAVEQAYARSDVFEKRRRMMESWAGYLSEQSAKVIRLS